MPKCSYKWCDSRNNKKLSFHRFPRNSFLRNRWLEVIGEENLTPKHKTWLLCSRHFDENCFNRTMSLIKLRDDTVPSIFQKPQTKKDESAKASMSPKALNNLKENVDLPVCPIQNSVNKTLSTSNLLQIVDYKHKIEQELAEEKIKMLSDKYANQKVRIILFNEKPQTKQDESAKPSMSPKALNNMEQELAEQKIRKLSDKCTDQKARIKRLNEKVRKRNIKIAHLNNIIKDLKEKQKSNAKHLVLLQECAGTQDFFNKEILGGNKKFCFKSTFSFPKSLLRKKNTLFAESKDNI